MKNMHKIKIVFLCALGFLLANACTKNFEELNTDPKIVTAEIIDPGLILTYVEENGIVEAGSMAMEHMDATVA